MVAGNQRLKEEAREYAREFGVKYTEALRAVTTLARRARFEETLVKMWEASSEMPHIGFREDDLESVFRVSKSLGMSTVVIDLADGGKTLSLFEELMEHRAESADRSPRDLVVVLGLVPDRDAPRALRALLRAGRAAGIVCAVKWESELTEDLVDLEFIEA